MIAAKTNARRNSCQATSGEICMSAMLEIVSAISVMLRLRAEIAAPAAAPSTKTGEAREPPIKPDNAPGFLPASATAARRPQESPTNPDKRIPASEPPIRAARNPTTPPIPPQTIPTLTALRCSCF